MSSQNRQLQWARARTITAWVMLIGSIIGWPLTALTVARREPQFVLGLSWLAIILTAMDLLSTSQVYERQDDDSTADGR